jgi:hypothetical protein
MISTRADRAEARRSAGVPGRIVRLGESKGRMYSGLSYEERLAAYWTLIQRAWIASGRSMPAAVPRGELPGEVFRLTRDA